jgi:PhzF family phenazine biosynthesis protein
MSKQQQQLSFVTLDVFTSTSYAGNPLAIIRVPGTVVLTQRQKQSIAREFNLSESVFLHDQTQQDRDDGSVRIDIFTAHAEVPFAGHPTVGTANYLLRLLQDDPLNGVEALQAKAGRFGITVDPAIPGTRIAVAHDVHIHASPFADQPFKEWPVVSIVKGMTFILTQLPDLEALATKTNNLLGDSNTYTACAALDEGWRQGIITSYFYVDLGYDHNKVRNLRIRNFGSREDPATGSAGCAAASYLSLQQGTPGRYRYHLTQGVEMGQRGDIFVEVAVRGKPRAPDRLEVEEVLLSGSAVLTMQGTLQVPSA